MRKIDRIDVIQWVLLALSLTIALAAWWQLSAFEKKANDLALRVATASTQLLIVRDTLTANTDFFDGFQREVSVLCSKKDTSALLNSCSLFDPEWTAFLNLYTKAAIRRATAKDSMSYISVENAYRAALPSLAVIAARDSSAAENTKLWKARILEGIAYSELEQANWKASAQKFHDAKRDIKTAIDLDNKSAFVGATALKIDCANMTAPEQIHAAFSALENRLINEKKRVDKLSGAILVQRDASLELQYLKADRELYQGCRYAGIRPP